MSDLTILGARTLVRILDALPAPALLCDGRGTVRWVSPALAEVLGVELAPLVGKGLRELPVDGLTVRPRADTICRARPPACPGRFKISASTIRSEAGVLELITLQPVAQSTNVVPILRGPRADPVSVRRARGGVDPATGLPNRASISQVLDAEVSRSRRYDNPLSILFVRLAPSGPDGGELGRELSEPGLSAGGPAYRAMIEVGRVLQEQTRWADNIGRWDAAEFLVVLPETGAAAAARLAEKLRRHLGVDPISAVVRFARAEWRRGDDATLLIDRARGRFC